MAMFMNRRRLLVELTSAAVFLAFFTHHGMTRRRQSPHGRSRLRRAASAVFAAGWHFFIVELHL